MNTRNNELMSHELDVANISACHLKGFKFKLKYFRIKSSIKVVFVKGNITTRAIYLYYSNIQFSSLIVIKYT